MTPAPAQEADIPTLWDVITWTEQRRSWAERVAAQRRREWVAVETPKGPGLALMTEVGRRREIVLIQARPASEDPPRPERCCVYSLTWAPDGEPRHERLPVPTDEPGAIAAAEAVLDGVPWAVVEDPGEVRRAVKRWFADTREPSTKTRQALARAGLRCPPTHGQATKAIRMLHTPAADRARVRWGRTETETEEMAW